MESSSQDRNLPASERKLEQSRKDGQVARSRDLSHIAVLGVGSFALLVLAPVLFDRLKLALAQQLRFQADTLLHSASMLDRLQQMTLVGLAAAVAFAAIVLVAAVGSTIAAGGWVVTTKPLMPQLNRLDPLSGFTKLFSKEKLVETGKLLVITGVLGAVAWSYLKGSIKTVAAMVMQPSVASIALLGQWLTMGMALLLLVVFVVALIDVPLQAFLHKSRLKMSHQEVKQEHKESEGNPQLKGQLRARAREIANRRSIQAVPKADFVLMNPTHFAVALRYDDKTMAAPQVIAKGADLLAMRIREVAQQHKVPVLQSPMLARALYAHAELDGEIPAALYNAVAQVLAYVYRLKAAMRGEGPMPEEQPTPFVPPELDPLGKTVLAESAEGTPDAPVDDITPVEPLR
ncbi:flagellar biosynthesis protein FlhB [Pseudorhodoferax sp. Leaf267]|uniref:EscU/YscU/HrcU family type III secretion system export apparatus switch protein n=1 Tax=Pseudorhodoferax sp. Leaf267 TaxID=1736316 RepID=UPI0006F9604B|nr:EscU/YscU/HrcU family type III secretion system export apparatus switch protein [Pseudorhodoferax sp. Leaf267]KQP13764.1 flagellar biosynthetic protein FlhB [Pseudorhodoferax sp. Leaf267]